MAISKAVDSDALNAALTYTAERIRAQTGSTDQIAWSAEKGFGEAVDGINAGSGTSGTLVDIPVTQYASYETMYSFIDAYSDVISPQSSWAIWFLNNTDTTRAGIGAINAVADKLEPANIVSRVGQTGTFTYGVDVYPGATIRVATFSVPHVGTLDV